MKLPEIFRIVELIELRRAVGPWYWRIEQVRESSGKPISETMTLLLALVIFDGYELFPARMTPDPEIKAKAIGTYNVLDRSKQYTREDPRELLRAVNEAWTKIRKLENEGTRKDADLAQLRERLRRVQYVNVALTSIITALAVKGLEILIHVIQ